MVKSSGLETILLKFLGFLQEHKCSNWNQTIILINDDSNQSLIKKKGSGFFEGSEAARAF